MVNVYGYCSKDANILLLGEIENYVNSTMRSHPNAKLIIGGDFNLVMNGSIDRFPPRANSESNDLMRLSYSLDLIDIWRVKKPFN